MRKETSNTWSDGLIMDLNPLNTPNTVLTDNLNGTLITYNGNEYSLQNDMGNYKLENCRLNPNYVPVGLKQYGDILYIVSYNPLDDTTEIGSYPSPLQVNNPNDGDDNVQIDYTINQFIKEGKTLATTAELEEKSLNIIFSEENLKLNPGDQYRIVFNEEHKPKYEDLNYYIIDEQKKQHDITDNIKQGLNKTGDKFVSWTVPGWLSIKSRIAQIEKFTMNLLNFKIIDGKLNSKIRFQFYLKDELFIKQQLSILNDLKVNFEISKKNSNAIYSKVINNSEVEYTMREWYDGNLLVQIEFEVESIEGLTDNDTIVIKATPELYDSISNFTIVYDGLIQRYESGVTNIKNITSENVIAGKTYYQFRTSSNNNGVDIVFDLSLKDDVNSLYYLNENLQLYLSIFTIDGKHAIGRINNTDIKLSGLGDYSVSINFENGFQKENLYIVQFILSETEPLYEATWSEETKNCICSKFLITNKAFNSFFGDSQYQKFDVDLDFDIWVNEYLKLIGENSKIIQTSDVSYEETEVVSNWKSPDNVRIYDQLISPETEQFFIGHKNNVNVEIKNELEENFASYKSGLWGSLLNNIEYEASAIDSSGNQVILNLSEEFSVNDGKISYNTHSGLIGEATSYSSEPFMYRSIIEETFNEKWQEVAIDSSFFNESSTYGGYIGHELTFGIRTADCVLIGEDTDELIISSDDINANDAFKLEDSDNPSKIIQFKNGLNRTCYYYATLISGNKFTIKPENGGSEEVLDGKEINCAVFRIKDNPNVLLVPVDANHTDYLNYIITTLENSNDNPIAILQKAWYYNPTTWKELNSIGTTLCSRITLNNTWLVLNNTIDLLNQSDRETLCNNFPNVQNNLLLSVSNYPINFDTPENYLEINYTKVQDSNKFPYQNIRINNYTEQYGKIGIEWAYNKVNDYTQTKVSEWNTSLVNNDLSSRNNNILGVYGPNRTITYNNSDFVKYTTNYYREDNQGKIGFDKKVISDLQDRLYRLVGWSSLWKCEIGYYLKG